MKTNNLQSVEELGKDFFATAVAESSCMSDLFRRCNLNPSSGHSRRTIMSLAKNWGVHIEFLATRGHSHVPYTKQEELLVDNSTVARKTVRKFILKNALLDYTTCSICGMSNTWNGKEITMILDHINGVSNDNRLENLRFICPNCNSQLSTTGSRNIKSTTKYRTVKRYARRVSLCPNCGGEKLEKSGTCKTCYNVSQRKIERPAEAQLLADVSAIGYAATGRKYGVSDNAIRKWLGLKK